MSPRKYGHQHGHLHAARTGDRRVLWAVAVNVLLTVAQIVGGIVAGSLSLIADALHNFSDAASLGIAFLARRIARRPSDKRMTFGYVRAEIVAALINYTTLIVVGLYLIYEAIMRFLEPQAVAGWVIVIIAGIALAVDLVTALLTYALSKRSMNIRAAFLHNAADALGSIGVIVAGTLIILFDWRWVDPAITIVIAGYILWLAFSEIGASIRMLMLGTPPELDIDDVIDAILQIDSVGDVHHVHVWAIDEEQTALEAHILVENSGIEGAEVIKRKVKGLLRDRFSIDHCTLELEASDSGCEDDDAKVVGHAIGPAR